MEPDLRGSATYAEIERYATTWWMPGSGVVRDLRELSVSPDGRRIACAAVMVERLLGVPPTRICIVELDSGALRVVTFGPHTDRLPKWSPDGRQLAFLSDRETPGRFQSYLLDLDSGAARALPRPQGWVEHYDWHPDGRVLLLSVAGVGADLAGIQGGVATEQATDGRPSWMPALDTGDETFRWRSLWLLDLDTAQAKLVTNAALNPWEACWLGRDALLTVASDSPDEAAWYMATLRHIDALSGAVRELYRPTRQIGWPSAAPDGRHAAVVEAVCSDRGLVAGELLVIDVKGVVVRGDVGSVDVTYTSWLSDHEVMYAGHRSLETVVGVYDIRKRQSRELWASCERTIGTRIGPEVAPVRGRRASFACVTTGFIEAPALQWFDDGALRRIRSVELGDTARLLEGISYERLRWSAPDGLEIHGWLLTPPGTAPRPLVMEAHGGPVWQYRHAYIGNMAPRLSLLKSGYAVFLPNPRGSSGRGQAYALEVFGDMGGADAHDCLSGLDALVERGIADPKRLGVMGVSYGGFMSSWLITQDARFAAAVPIAPVTNWVSEHLTCHISLFCEQFLADSMKNMGGRYYTRSPVFYADRVSTPTLLVCGALDRNTPPGQALEFHNALRLHGVESLLATYPEEGHGIRSYPAVIDFATRVVEWFGRHMPANGPPAT